MPNSKRYQEIADRFEEIARESVQEPRPIADICKALAIGQRTLARAVRAIHGTTALRYQRSVRLAEARKALLDGSCKSVTLVALRFGFRELGRFAADYRTAFGESPSQTLRRTSTAPGSQHQIPQVAAFRTQVPKL